MLAQVGYIQSHSCYINRYSWIAFELIKTEEGLGFFCLHFICSIQAELFTRTGMIVQESFTTFYEEGYVISSSVSSKLVSPLL